MGNHDREGEAEETEARAKKATRKLKEYSDLVKGLTRIANSSRDLDISFLALALLHVLRRDQS